MIKNILLFILLFPSVSMSQELKTIQINPLRPDTVGGLLGDIDCRMGGWPDWKIYRDPDKVTWAHEGTHSVNARLRMENRGLNGFYLLNGTAVILSNPKITLKNIADAIPREKRQSSLYKLYLVDAQPHWNHRPFYCIDELVAYLNGTVIGVEHNMDRRSIESYGNNFKKIERKLEDNGHYKLFYKY
jgi:hypothetical protein